MLKAYLLISLPTPGTPLHWERSLTWRSCLLHRLWRSLRRRCSAKRRRATWRGTRTGRRTTLYETWTRSQCRCCAFAARMTPAEGTRTRPCPSSYSKPTHISSSCWPNMAATVASWRAGPPHGATTCCWSILNLSVNSSWQRKGQKVYQKENVPEL